MKKRSRSAQLAGLCILFLVTGCGRSGPAATVERFYSLIDQGEVAEATSMITGDLVATFGTEKLEASLAQAAQDASKKGGVRKMRIVSEEVEGNSATLVIEIAYGNGESETEKVNLARLNGEWMIVISLDDK